MREFFAKLFQRRTERPDPQRPKPSPDTPLGLSRDQLDAIAELTDSLGYEHYLKAVERLYENQVSALLRPLAHDAYLFQCGVCYALEQVASLPQDLTLKLREHDAQHTAKSLDADPGAAVFANTPFWDAYRARGPRQYGGAGVPLPGRGNGSPVSPGQNGE